MVGDDPECDIKGAQALGLRAIWRRTAHQQLAEVRPDAILDRMEQLPDAVRPWL